MDILIKNMEMPRGNNVLVVDSAGTITKVNRWTGKVEAADPFSVKAVALPEHGRLGDLDALKNSVADMRMEKPLRNGAKQVIEIGELFGRIIDNAPTIVEATNE